MIRLQLLENLIEEGKYDKIAVAVSGGSDSIALLSLATPWAKARNVQLVVMIVDHGKRQQSKEEVRYVKEYSHSLGWECLDFLLTSEDLQGGNFQEKARNLRYAALTNTCKRLDIKVLLTAHHQDDYLENLLLRKRRKSGILGLSVSPRHFINDVMVVRPLFDVPKSALLEHLIKANIKWFEDESNNSDEYDRNVVRKQLLSMDEASKLALRQEQEEINQQAKQLSLQLVAAIAETTKISEFGFAEIALPRLQKYSSVTIQVLSYVLTIISGNNVVPRANSVTRILEHISSGEDFIKTLHECCLVRTADSLTIYREFGRTMPRDVPLTEGAVWDNRFCVTVCSDICHGYTITHLTIQGYNTLRKNFPELQKLHRTHNKQILFTLPVIKKLEKIVALPHISYYYEEHLKEAVRFLFHPRFISRFTHFC